MDYLIDDQDLFEALGIKEEWEEQELSDEYAEQDARTLKEYGFWFRNSYRAVFPICPSHFRKCLPMAWSKYSYHKDWS